MSFDLFKSSNQERLRERQDGIAAELQKRRDGDPGETEDFFGDGFYSPASDAKESSEAVRMRFNAFSQI